MTGPEHYRTAEDLLKQLGEVESGSSREVAMIAEAQVHATLALAAATALPATRILLVSEYKARAAVAAVKTEEDET